MGDKAKFPSLRAGLGVHVDSKMARTQMARRRGAGPDAGETKGNAPPAAPGPPLQPARTRAAPHLKPGLPRGGLTPPRATPAVETQ